MKKIAVLILACISILLATAMADDFLPMSPNYVGFTETEQHITIGDVIYTEIYGDINSIVDTVSLPNNHSREGKAVTFLPSGIINYSNVIKGDLFNDAYTIFFINPVNNATNNDIDNTEGWVKDFCWAVDAPGGGAVNNTNATMFNISWTSVSCGTVTIEIEKNEGATVYDGEDPGTTIQNSATVHVHPMKPTGLNATATSPTTIALDWTKQTGADTTLIRGSETAYPTSPDGPYVYNGTGTYTELSASAGSTYYYSAWGWNETAGFYSLEYDSATNTTPSGNAPPDEPTLIYPVNNSDYFDVYDINFTAHVTDIDGGSLDVSFHWGNHTVFNSTTVSDDSDAVALVEEFQLPSWNDWLEHDTTYTWYVNVTDGEYTETSEKWTFTTCKAWDLNVDKTVNYLDISILVSHYLETMPYPGMYPWDINNDADTNYLDVSGLVSHYLENY